jgi:prepilin-type N-terminal cleavage/methylation domain-containing protein
MKKGFTLIELLAVIIILAVIALIATPIALNVINNAKKQANKDSAYGLLDAAKLYYSESILDSNQISKLDGNTNLINELSITGKMPTNGELYINETGEIALYVVYDVSCYTKSFTDTDLKETPDSEECNKITSSDYNKGYTDGYQVGYKDGSNITVKDESLITYGVRRKLNAISTEWERIEDSVGLYATAQVGTEEVLNDFDSIYPWSDIISYNYDTTTNQITAYYGDDNFKFDGSNGEVLTKIPEFYYKRYQDDTYEYVYISKNALEGYSKSEEFSIGRYTISGSSARVYSKSGVKPLVSTTITNFRTYARNLGTGFGIMDYHYFLIQLLYLVEYADYNSQAKLGLGYANASNKAAITSGGTDFLGMKSGSVDGTDTASVIYRGIEDIFGNVWQFIDGINIQNNQAYICYDQTQYDSDTFTGCYQKIGYVNASSDGFVSKLGYDLDNPLVAFPIEVNGNNFTGVSDNYMQNSGNKVALVGGRYISGGLDAGLWYWALSEVSSFPYAHFGARLIKIN